MPHDKQTYVNFLPLAVCLFAAPPLKSQLRSHKCFHSPNNNSALRHKLLPPAPLLLLKSLPAHGDRQIHQFPLYLFHRDFSSETHSVYVPAYETDTRRFLHKLPTVSPYFLLTLQKPVQIRHPISKESRIFQYCLPNRLKKINKPFHCYFPSRLLAIN